MYLKNYKKVEKDGVSCYLPPAFISKEFDFLYMTEDGVCSSKSNFYDKIYRIENLGNNKLLNLFMYSIEHNHSISFLKKGDANYLIYLLSADSLSDAIHLFDRWESFLQANYTLNIKALNIKERMCSIIIPNNFTFSTSKKYGKNIGKFLKSTKSFSINQKLFGISSWPYSYESLLKDTWSLLANHTTLLFFQLRPILDNTIKNMLEDNYIGMEYIYPKIERQNFPLLNILNSNDESSFSDFFSISGFFYFEDDKEEVYCLEQLKEKNCCCQEIQSKLLVPVLSGMSYNFYPYSSYFQKSKCLLQEETTSSNSSSITIDDINKIFNEQENSNV